jgi:hypothetical protein
MLMAGDLTPKRYRTVIQNEKVAVKTPIFAWALAIWLIAPGFSIAQKDKILFNEWSL